jgi:DNA ligase-4
MPMTGYDCVKSPLSTVSIYISSELHLDELSAGFSDLTNIARTLEEFIIMLSTERCSSNMEKPNTAAAPQDINLGIIFADHSLTPLGPKLLNLIQQLSQAFRAPTSNLHPKGRIFLLNFQFLQFDADLKHNKFCLRKTWEQISRAYFYACIAWDPVCHGPIDEFPATALDNDAEEDCQSTGLRRTSTPKLRISFDRKEILLLGEFSSLDPLVRVGAQSG